MLDSVSLATWDEAPMQNRFCPEAVSRMFQDVKRKPKQSFGGVTMVFGGDFQQILPVIIKGSREDIVSASLQCSTLWPNITILHLTQNMRLRGDPNSVAFAQWLLDVGHGRNNTTAADGSIQLPQHMRCGDDMDALINAIYPGIGNLPLPQDHFLLERTILSSRNDEVADINDTILEKFPGELKVMHGANQLILEEGGEEQAPWPEEYLASIRTSGLPLSELKLKVGVPLMLLWNCPLQKASVMALAWSLLTSGTGYYKFVCSEAINLDPLPSFHESHSSVRSPVIHSNSLDSNSPFTSPSP